MGTEQQGDVLLYENLDGGEINVTGGVIEMAGSLETSAYLSLFGGNEGDDGTQGNSLNYWGNLAETQPERQYRSETQAVINTCPPIPANLIKIEDAARRDLAWMVSTNVASSVEVSATMPAPKTVKLVVQIGADQTIEFIETWRADAS